MAQPVLSLSRQSRHDIFEAILTSLNAMPEPLRKIFVLSHYQGKSNPEIAAHFDLPASQVATRLQEANLRFYQGLRKIRGH